MGANTYPRTQSLVAKTVSVPAGQTVTVAKGDTSDFLRIVGVAQTNHAVTLQCYQGSGIAPSNLEFADDAVSVPANAAEGAGEAFNFLVCGRTCRVDLVNAGNSAATVNMYVALKGA